MPAPTDYKKLSDYAAATSVGAADQVYLVQGGATKPAAVPTLFGGGGLPGGKNVVYLSDGTLGPSGSLTEDGSGNLAVASGKTLTLAGLSGVVKAAAGVLSGGGTTSDVPEGTNLYYTTSRFNSAFAGKTTTDLAEGSNLYYTNARADARIALQRGGVNGLASLDGGGKVPNAQLPALAVTDTFPVVSQASMLALAAERGDVAVRSDLNKSFILAADDPTVLANWQELLTPTDAVLSVFGRTGVVNAQAGDYTAAQVTNAVSTLGSYADPSWITSLAASKSGLGTADSPTFTGLTLTGLTSGWVPYVAAGGLLAGGANMTFDGTSLVLSGTFRPPVFAQAALPAAASAGRLLYQTDRRRGLVVDTGAALVPLNARVVNVLEHGLKNDNSTDNSPLLQALHDDTTNYPAGTVFYFPDGTYRFRSAVTWTRQIHIRGAGSGSTFFAMDNATSTTASLFAVNVGGATLFNLVWSGFYVGAVGADRTAGAGIYLGAIGKAHFNDVRVGSALGTKPFYGLRVEQASDTVFGRLEISGCASHGVYMSPAAGNCVIVEVCFQDGSAINSNGGHGMLLEENNNHSSGANSLEGIHLGAVTLFGNALDGLRLSTTVPTAKISNIHLNGAVIDSNLGNGITAAGSGQARTVTLDHIWISFNTGVGISLDATATHWNIDGGDCLLSGQQGIYVNDAADVTVRGVRMHNNSRGSNGTYYGIELAGTSSFVFVSGCNLYNTLDYTANCQNGVKVASTCSNVVVAGSLLNVQDGAGGGAVLQPINIGSGAVDVYAHHNLYTASEDPALLVDVRGYGAKGDLQAAANGANGSAANRLSSATANFTAADVGKVVIITGGATPTSVTNTLATASGSAAFTLAGATLTQADVGKWIALPGAGASGATLYTTIASVTGTTTGTLAVNASTTQATSQTVLYAGWFTSTISSRNSATEVTLAASIPNTSLASAPFAWGTDDAAAIQKAIDTVPGQACLFLPAGNYLIATGLTINNKQVSVRGAGIAETLIFTSGNIHTISVNVGQAAKTYGMTFSDFSIGARADQTAGAALRLGNVGQVSVQNVKVANSLGGRVFRGLWVARASQCFFDKLRVAGCADHGVFLDPDASGSVVVDLWFGDQCQFDGNLGDGVRIQNRFANASGNENLQGVYFGACSIYNNYTTGVHFNCGNAVKNCFFRGTIVDSNHFVGFWVDAAGGAAVKYLRLENCWVSFNGNPSLVPAGADQSNIYLDSVVTDFLISNCYVLLAGRTGITLSNVSRGVVQGCVVEDNSQTSSAAYGGLSLSGTTSSISLQRNRVYNSYTTAAKQNGLVVTSTCSDIDLAGNFFDTNFGSGGSNPTTPRNISATAVNVREWGNTYDTSTGNLVPFTGDGLAATPQDVVLFNNTVASTSGVPAQYAPSARWSGRAWDTGAAADRYCDARAYVKPVTGNPATAQLVIGLGVGASALPPITDLFTFDSSGNMAMTGKLSGGVSTAAVAFTDGDTARRVTVADARVTAASNVLGVVKRPTTALADDRGYVYTANVVSVGTGTFDVDIICQDTDGSDPVLDPPNETVTYCYLAG